MKKWYGSLNNRLEENKMFCDEIKVGTGMTEYSWSDREAYEVVEVINQKNVKVRKLDHKAVGEAMSNTWELSSNPNNPVKELKFRYGKWNWVNIITNESIKKAIILDNKLFKAKQKLEAGADKVEIFRDANVSFGIADYYYDYEF